MALVKSVELENGLVAPEADIRINGVSVDFINGTPTLHMAAYLNEQAFTDGKPPIKVWNLNLPLDKFDTALGGIDKLQLKVYAYLSTLSQNDLMANPAIPALPVGETTDATV